MPTKRTFDLIIITGVLLIPAFGLVRMAAARWKAQPGIVGDVGRATEIVLGKS